MTANASNSDTKYQTNVWFVYGGEKNVINQIKESNSSPASLFCKSGAWAAILSFAPLEKCGSSLGKFAMRKIVPGAKNQQEMGKIVGLLTVASVMGLFFRKLFDYALHSKGVFVPDYMSYACVPSSNGQIAATEVTQNFQAWFEHFGAEHKKALDEASDVKFTPDEEKRFRAAKLGVTVGPILAVLGYLNLSRYS